MNFFRYSWYSVLIAILAGSCNSLKNVAENELLLTENQVFENGVVLKENQTAGYLLQDPNSKVLGLPIRLYIYNWARDSAEIHDPWLNSAPKRREHWESFLSKKQLDQWGASKRSFNDWLRRIGEAPSIIDTTIIQKNLKRLNGFYFNDGYFNSFSEYKILPKKNPKKAVVSYEVNTGPRYELDTISTEISSPQLDSIYQLVKEGSLIKSGAPFRSSDLQSERNRLTAIFQNNGVWDFEISSIRYDAFWDTTGADQKVPLKLIIDDHVKRSLDSIEIKPYKVHRIGRVNLYTDDSYRNKEYDYTDTTQYKGINIYSKGKLRYRPKSLIDAVFISPGNYYRAIDRTLTYRQLNNLRNFNYPTIQYLYADSTETDLQANIYLTPRKKYSLNAGVDLLHSNIQDFGISFSGSVINRNIFRGAENLEISLRGTIGTSRTASAKSTTFFNVLEFGGDVKLSFPRFLAPFNIDSWVPGYMSPTTLISLGTTIQTNIGLDKQNFLSLLSYKWKPDTSRSHSVEYINLEYVNNRNPDNYFNIYSNAYDDLNELAQDVNYNNPDDLDENGNLIVPSGADSFLDQASDPNSGLGLTNDQFIQASAINERKTRLTTNNLILATNYTFIKNTKENLLDERFYQFKAKIELAGNSLQLISSLFNRQKNDRGNYELFGLEYSQYVKLELDYIKHFFLSKGQVLAFRSFVGMALPYGNADNIPFTRSYFAGGSNDNRAWEVYSLGPGSSSSNNEFNEANLKIALNLEYRFNLFGNFKGALFADSGNIWHWKDNVKDEASSFNGIRDLGELALGSGFGLRYDLSYVVIRLDIGFKTYDPSRPSGSRWFKDYNFGNATYNIGINYPF